MNASLSEGVTMQPPDRKVTEMTREMTWLAITQLDESR